LPLVGNMNNEKLFLNYFGCIFQLDFNKIRVYLEYHSVEQVAVGALIGSFLGAIWFMLVHNVFSQYFHTITSWYIISYNFFLNIRHMLIFH